MNKNRNLFIVLQSIALLLNTKIYTLPVLLPENAHPSALTTISAQHNASILKPANQLFIQGKDLNRFTEVGFMLQSLKRTTENLESGDHQVYFKGMPTNIKRVPGNIKMLFSRTVRLDFKPTAAYRDSFLTAHMSSTNRYEFASNVFKGTLKNIFQNRKRVTPYALNPWNEKELKNNSLNLDTNEQPNKF